MANYLATIRGTLSSGTLGEIFVHTFAIISSSTQDQVAQSLANNWKDCLNNNTPYNLKDVFPGEVVYNEVTAAQILNAEPPEPRLASASHVTFTGIPGTGSGGMVPSQCAIAVSVKAGTRPNGLPQKGRFYLPTPAFGSLQAATGLLAPAYSTNIRDQLASFWAAMNAAGHRPALWSRTYGTVKQWDAIRVGNRIDTVRRRRNANPETYTPYVTVA